MCGYMYDTFHIMYVHIYICTPLYILGISIGCSMNRSQIEVRGVNYTSIVESSDQSRVSVLVNQLDQNFTKGESHTVRLFATNSVGTSDPQSALLIVPCESLVSCVYHNCL